MGINGLWKLIEDANACNFRGSLQTLAIRNGFDGPQVKPYIVGIDASIWIYQTAATFAAGHAQSGHNPELRTFLYRLFELLESGVVPLFVFDGPERPEKKRGRRVSPTEHWMVGACIKMILALGFYIHHAPGEAEAELALLNKTGVIDAVMTEDSDVFAFGATTVLRKSRKPRASITDVEQYSLVQIPQLGPSDIILIGLMSGCDYDESGVPGCGPSISQGISRYGFGRSLCAAAESLSTLQLIAFAVNWRVQVAECLLNDPEGFIGHRCLALASSLSDDFPKLDIVKKLLNPKTSHPLPDRNQFKLQLPDFPLLTQWCERYFEWDLTKLLGIYKRKAWPGLVTRMLTLEAMRVSGGITSQVDTLRMEPMLTVNVCNITKNDFDDACPVTCRLQIVPKTFNNIAVGLATCATHDQRNPPSTFPKDLHHDSNPAESRSYLLPFPILQRARPAAVASLAYDDSSYATVLISHGAFVLNLHLAYVRLFSFNTSLAVRALWSVAGDVPGGVEGYSNSQGLVKSKGKGKAIDLTREDVEIENIDFDKDEKEMAMQDKEFIDLTVGDMEMEHAHAEGSAARREIIDLTVGDTD